MEYYFEMFLGVLVLGYLIFYGISLRLISQEICVDKKDEKNQIYATGISVIVPFKNEERHLKKLIHCLSSQSLAHHQVEFLLVNDHSTDNSQELAKQSIPNHFFTILSLPLNLHGKKQAIKYGIEHSQFDWILTTDADCIHPDNWLSEMSKNLNHEQIAMRIGQVSYTKPKNLLETMIFYESTLLSGFQQKMHSLQRPVLASGANLLFSKKALNTMGGYAPSMDIASGDDIFLLHQFKQKLGAQFINYQETKVTTCYPETWSSFFKQRVRWAGKAKYYKDQDSILSGIWIGCIQLFFLTLTFLLILQGRWMLFVIFSVIKFSLECVFFKFPFNIKHLLGSLIYPWASIWIVLLSLIYQPRWKP